MRLRRILTRRVDAAIRAGLEVDRPAMLGEVEALLTRFAAAGVVDDAAWGAARARRLVGRGVAPTVVRQRLRSEGVDASVALRELEGDIDVRSACAYVRRRRMGPFRVGSASSGDLAKMGRAGFSYAVANKVLAMSLEEIETAAAEPL